MTQLSIIIPAWGSAELLETTLGSVLRRRPPACEVLVIHGGDYDDPYDVCDEVLFVESPGATPVDLLNVGWEIAEGEFLHYLSCGVEVSENWCEAPLDHFDDPRVAAVAAAVVAPNGRRLASAGVNYISNKRKPNAQGVRVDSRGKAPSPLGPSLQAAFYRRDCLEWLGGFDDEVGRELADVDLALCLQKLGYQCDFEPDCLLQDSPEALPSLPAFDDGLGSERLYLRHAGKRGIGAKLSHLVEIALDSCGQAAKGRALQKLRGRWAAQRDRSVVADLQRQLDDALESATSANVHAFPQQTESFAIRRAA